MKRTTARPPARFECGCGQSKRGFPTLVGTKAQPVSSTCQIGYGLDARHLPVTVRV
ncbi:MAG: hypothetical protein IPI20_10575 [Rhodoferax sp.]|nr:hypothetical protein [Rhodoferax sp.]